MKQDIWTDVTAKCKIGEGVALRNVMVTSRALSNDELRTLTSGRTTFVPSSTGDCVLHKRPYFT